MRVFLIVTLYNILNVILAQFDIINEDIGDFHFQAEIGNLPLKYIPLTEKDQKASEKAADLIDFIQLVPKIDPLNIPVIEPLGIDVPFLWLSGKVYMENFILAGVKQLELDGLELRLITLRSDVNITMPQLYLEGDFHLQATLSFLPVKFRCHISAYLYDVGIAMSSGGYKKNNPEIGQVLQIDSACLKIDIRDIVFNLTDMVIGEELGEEQEEEERSPSTQLFNSRSGSTTDENLLNSVLKTVLDMANKKLSMISIQVFEDYLLSDSY